MSAAGLAACRAAIKCDSDPFRQVWRTSDYSTRLMLLSIAKRPAYLAPMFWDELAPDTRGAIKARAASLRDWLNKTLPAVAS